MAKKSSITWWTNRVFKSGVQNFQCNRASHLSDLLHLRCYYMHNNVLGNSWGRVYNQCAFRISLTPLTWYARANIYRTLTINVTCCVCTLITCDHVYVSVCVMVFGWRFQHSVFFFGGFYSGRCEIESSLKIHRMNIVFSCYFLRQTLYDFFHQTFSFFSFLFFLSFNGGVL